MHRPPLLFRTVLIGQHLVVIVLPIDEPLAGALLLVNQGVSDTAAIRPLPATGMAPIHPWNFHADKLFF